MPKRSLIYPIFLPMQGCRHRCIYCDQSKISGGSSFDLELELANVAKFVANHKGETKEVAFYGSSFTALPDDFIQSMLKKFNRVIDPDTSYRISTHPAYVTNDILDRCKQRNIACIELGVQDFYDDVLLASQRGYTGKQALEAALAIREHGFTLGVQLMPGLPGSNAFSIKHNKSILRMLKPDYLRLYPLVVIRGTPICAVYERGEYIALELEEAVDICADYVELAESEGIVVIKLGLPSNLSSEEVLAGPYHPSFGEIVKTELLIRDILRRAQRNEEINLDKKSSLLLMGHRGKYRAILLKRLENCSINVEAISRIL